MALCFKHPPVLLVLAVSAVYTVDAAPSVSAPRAALCNLTGVWQSVGANDPISVVQNGATFWATAQSGFQNASGTVFPNNTAWFSCCGGITGDITDNCSVITWHDQNNDQWARNYKSLQLSTGSITLGVSARTDGGTASISTFFFFAAGANTTNLPPVLPDGDSRGGGTWLGAAGVTELLLPRCKAPACAIAANSSSLVVAGLSLTEGDGETWANEDWSFSVVNASALSWTISRVYMPAAVSAPLALAFTGLTLQTTGGLPIHSQQIPSYADTQMFYNASSTGGFDMRNSFFEYLSPNARQAVRFSPTGALFTIEGSATFNGAPMPLFFSFSKPFADGTAWCSLGFESVDRRGAGRVVSAGVVETVTIVMALVANDVPVPPGVVDPFPALDLYLPNQTLSTQISTLVAVQYQLNGWIFGNNPASVPCLHEMAWWPLVSALFPAPGPGSSGGIAVAAMQLELAAFVTCGWQPSEWIDEGEHTAWSCDLAAGAQFGLSQRWASSGFYWCPWGPLQDQNVMLPIAVAQTAAASGDLAWLRSLLPALQALQQYLASRGLALSNGTRPVVFASPASGLADGGRHASNWYDVIEFGHYDAFLAVHGVWAMQCLADIYAALGLAADAAAAQAVHDAAAADFNALFYNSSAAAYADWIDTSGRARYYFYVDIPFLAITAGIASPTQATALLGHYDTRLAQIYSQYSVPPGNIWSAPCSLYPVTDAGDFCNGPEKGFPSYENGGSFFHSEGFHIAALGAAGRPDDAYAAFLGVMNSGFGATRGWAQQLYWGPDDSLVGGDPLNSALVIVWGFVRGCFGVETALGGLRAVGAPAAALEGARLNISVLGVTQCIAVTGGEARYCNGSIVRRAVRVAGAWR